MLYAHAWNIETHSRIICGYVNKLCHVVNINFKLRITKKEKHGIV